MAGSGGSLCPEGRRRRIEPLIRCLRARREEEGEGEDLGVVRLVLVHRGDALRIEQHQRAPTRHRLRPARPVRVHVGASLSVVGVEVVGWDADVDAARARFRGRSNAEATRGARAELPRHCVEQERLAGAVEARARNDAYGRRD